MPEKRSHVSGRDGRAGVAGSEQIPCQCGTTQGRAPLRRRNEEEHVAPCSVFQVIQEGHTHRHARVHAHIRVQVGIYILTGACTPLHTHTSISCTNTLERVSQGFLS